MHTIPRGFASGPGVGRAGDEEWANKGIDHKSAPQRVRLAAKAAPYRVWSSLTLGLERNPRGFGK